MSSRKCKNSRGRKAELPKQSCPRFNTGTHQQPISTGSIKNKLASVPDRAVPNQWVLLPWIRDVVSTISNCFCFKSSSSVWIELAKWHRYPFRSNFRRQTENVCQESLAKSTSPSPCCARSAAFDNSRGRRTLSEVVIFSEVIPFNVAMRIFAFFSELAIRNQRRARKSLTNGFRELRLKTRSIYSGATGFTECRAVLQLLPRRQMR